MRCTAFLVSSIALAQPALAEEPPRLTYRTYALGVPIADVEGRIGLGRFTYQLIVTFRTTGAARLVFAGHHTSTVFGQWQDDRPAPRRYSIDGHWRGTPRVTLIDYEQGSPAVRQLLPPLEWDREVVGAALRANSTDALSAMASVIRLVGKTGRCDSTSRTFDGRRAADVVAHTAGTEILPPTERSSFSGVALRCDFVSRVIAGLRQDEATKTDYRPLRGSAWLAATTPGSPPIPVRVALETRWFGTTTSYVTGSGGQ